jgi:hypothetical protein
MDKAAELGLVCIAISITILVVSVFITDWLLRQTWRSKRRPKAGETWRPRLEGDPWGLNDYGLVFVKDVTAGWVRFYTPGNEHAMRLAAFVETFTHHFG